MARSGRGIAQLINSIGHRVNTYSTSAAFTKPSTSGGLLSWLGGGSPKAYVHLGSPLPGVHLSPPLPDYVEPSKAKITTLPNGVRVASETSTNPVASIGLYVDCGSVNETPSLSGASHLLERMAFKTTTNRSHLRLVREVEAIGGKVTATASREQMSYTYDALKSYVPEMLEVLIDSVRNPVFLDWEVHEQLLKVKAEIKEIKNHPEGLLLEAIHSVGFLGALSNPLLAPEPALSTLNGDMLEQFVVENYTAPRMVLAASGVDHEELLALAEPLLSDLPAVPHSQKPMSQYTGGDYRYQADSPHTHVALAFEVPGGWHNENEAMKLTVLQVLMGGGSSFSNNGPGKGLYSRLNTRVLDEYQQLDSFSAFNSIYNDTSLFGIHFATGYDCVFDGVDIAIREFFSIATPGKVTPEELNRAKEGAKAGVLYNLESRTMASEDIGRQVLTFGERKPVEHFLKALDQVTLEDITSIAKNMISSRLTMASWGNIAKVPSYEYASEMFQKFQFHRH